MKVLVTGGAGYIGSHTCVSLMSAGYEVAVLDNLSNGHFEAVLRAQQLSGHSLRFYNADLRDKADVEKVFYAFQPEAVIHFAALKSVEESIREPLLYYESNVAGSVILLQVMSEYKVKQLVFSSTANVYGHALDVPISEDSHIAPTNPYGRSKAMIEQILSDIVASEADWRVARLRYFNPMGAHPSGIIGEDPRGVPSNLPPYIAQVALGRRSQLQIFGGDYDTPDGTGVRDYIHVVDLAEGHVAALNYLTNNMGLVTANLGTGRGYSVLEMVKAFERVSGHPIPYRIVGRRSGDVAKSYAATNKAEKLFAWKARFGLDDMCRDAWRWQVMNPSGYSRNN